MLGAHSVGDGLPHPRCPVPGEGRVLTPKGSTWRGLVPVVLGWGAPLSGVTVGHGSRHDLVLHHFCH